MNGELMQKVHNPVRFSLTGEVTFVFYQRVFTLVAELSVSVRLIVLLCCMKAKKNQRLFADSVRCVLLAYLVRRSKFYYSPCLPLRPLSYSGKILLSLQRCFVPVWTVLQLQCNPCSLMTTIFALHSLQQKVTSASIKCSFGPYI